ncbi:MAG: WbuC family cupin fold metalloprotein [Dysgonamonadaceae bacterium]|jgi:cupin fold WbuC family metalloprotein|nr:WbuC family cupin fold metalloprotein [Dysgonamonadaceae bacterium]
MLIINKLLLDETTAKAIQSERLRMNYNIHKQLEDPVNRMLNALEPHTYLRPHRHWTPPKTEAYIVLRGELDVLIFDDEGKLIQRVALNPEIDNYGVDIPAGVWHSMIVKQSGTVIYELKEGPFTPLAPEDFAPWSPEPNDEEGIKAFFNQYS